MNIEIANRLATLRKESGMSQEELAQKLGISRQAVSKWERAESSPDTDNLIALSKLYSVSLDNLLEADEESIENETYAKQHSQDNNNKEYNNSTMGCQNEPNPLSKMPLWIALLFPIFPILITALYFITGWIIGSRQNLWIMYLSIPIFYSLIGFYRITQDRKNNE